MPAYKKDIDLLKANLINLPTFWDGKTCILELKEADYQWRQMEWWAFYFEYKVKEMLADKFLFPGDKYNIGTSGKNIFKGNSTIGDYAMLGLAALPLVSKVRKLKSMSQSELNTNNL